MKNENKNHQSKTPDVTHGSSSISGEEASSPNAPKTRTQKKQQKYAARQAAKATNASSPKPKSPNRPTKNLQVAQEYGQMMYDVLHPNGVWTQSNFNTLSAGEQHSAVRIWEHIGFRVEVLGDGFVVCHKEAA